VLAIAVRMTGFSSGWIGLCVSIRYSVILPVVCNMSVNELLCYIILSLACSMLFAAWENSKLKKSFMLIICCLQTVVPTIFYYLQYGEYALNILLISLVLGIVLLTDKLNPLITFMGVMTLKLGAYLQPFTHKFMNYLFHEVDPIPQPLCDEAAEGIVDDKKE